MLRVAAIVVDGTRLGGTLLSRRPDRETSFVYTCDPWGVQTLVSSSGQGAAQNPYAFHGGSILKL